MFDLKAPCVNCPFRKGLGGNFRLHPERLESIRDDVAFQCHKTVDYSDDTTKPGEKPQQCAGLMAVLWREEKPNRIMQFAMSTGHLDPDDLDPRGEAYETWGQVMRAHETGKEPE